MSKKKFYCPTAHHLDKNYSLTLKPHCMQFRFKNYFVTFSSVSNIFFPPHDSPRQKQITGRLSLPSTRVNWSSRSMGYCSSPSCKGWSFNRAIARDIPLFLFKTCPSYPFDRTAKACKMSIKYVHPRAE